MSSMFSNTSERLYAMAGLGALNNGQNNAIGALNAAQPQSLAALGSGYDQGRAAYGQAMDMFNPYVTAGQSGLGMYQNSLGLNGASGNDAATAAFRASPGYQYQVDQATDQVARNASATGALGSGNTLAAISDRAQHLADQDYGNWQGQLQGLGQMGLQATGAQAGLMKGLGDLDVNQGRDTAGVYNNTAQQTAQIYGNNATQALGIFNNLGAHAGDASANTWNMAMNGAKTAGALGSYAAGAGGLNGLASLGGLGSGFGNLFSLGNSGGSLASLGGLDGPTIDTSQTIWS